MKGAILWFVAAGLMLFTWLLGLNGPNEASTVWMIFAATAFFVIGCSQMAIGRGKRRD